MRIKLWILLVSATLLVACSEQKAEQSDQSVAATVSASSATNRSSGVGAIDIIQADSSSWLSHGRTYSEQRHSPLASINKDSVSGLGLAWSYDLGTSRGIEATPIVRDGVIYVTSTWNIVHALDARSGETLWTFDPIVDKAQGAKGCCDVVNRG
ncbi:MAG: quinohemoprotein ethanol dehydrogenase, partial [Arenicella sp.]